MKVRIGVASLAPKLYDKDHNLELMRSSIDGNDDLVLFPELYLTGYSIRDEVYHLAETVPGPSTDAVKAIASDTGAHILFGMAEKEMVEEDGKTVKKIYNTSVLIAPDGSLWKFRKMHPVHFGPFEEDVYFTPGNWAEVAKTSIGRIGMTICYDIFFPELVKSYALKGADIITNISASPHITRPFFEKVLPARAIESTVFMAYSNTVGVYNNMMFWGGSRIIGPKSKVFAEGGRFAEGVVRADICLSDLPMAREMRPTLNDTREYFSYL